MTELHTDGPHNPDYTREVADTLAQAARVLAHATQGDDGLVNPADAYDLAGTLSEACRSLEQTLRQTGRFVEQAGGSGRLRDTNGNDPALAASHGARYLHAAADADDNLSQRLEQAQQTIAGLADGARG